MSKKPKPNDTLMVTTGIRKKIVFLEIECPDSVTSGKVLAIVDHFIDELKNFEVGEKDD